MSFDSKDIDRNVGSQILIIRRSKEISATELAKKSGISNSMLSKIERGESSPSISSLSKIARALNVPVARLFAGYEDRKDCSLVKAGQGLKVERLGTRNGHNYELLGHNLSGELFVEPYLITIKNGAKPFQSFQHKGMEFIYLISGKMKYKYADKSFMLTAGDSILFDSTSMHGPEKLFDEDLRYISVVLNIRT